MAGVPKPERERGVYGISVAAELVGTGVQNLRAYEAHGLLEPERTPGGTRRYSAEDLDRLRRIGDLLDAGLNLAGIGMVIDLETQNSKLRAEKKEYSWLTTASIPASRPAKRTPTTRNPTPPTTLIDTQPLIDLEQTADVSLSEPGKGESAPVNQDGLVWPDSAPGFERAYPDRSRHRRDVRLQRNL